MITEKDLTPAQRRCFNEETDEDWKEDILSALNRKPIVKQFKSGRTLEARYGYDDGYLEINAVLTDQDGKKLWKGTYHPIGDLMLSGEERASIIIDYVIEAIWTDMTDMDDEWHEQRAFGLLKRLL